MIDWNCVRRIPRNYREVLRLVVVLGLVCWLGGFGYGAEKTRPNIVLIMTDDQGYGDLHCHGNKILKTPNLDKFYRQSIRLTNFHVDPTCSPTRSALMTGRYSARVGVWHTIMGRSLLRQGEVTLAEILREAGYATGIFGKWHLGDNYPCRPQDRGFEEVFVHGGGGVGQTPDYWGNNYFDDTYWHNGKTKKVEGYCTDVWFDAAMKFMRKSKERPFFCYIPTNAAHGPYIVGEKYRNMYVGKPGVRNPNFYGMITNIDENVGRLLQFLEEQKMAENTIVIFMTDNGSAVGGYNCGMKGYKGSEYEGGHRVPCFIRWPQGKLGGGRDIDRLTAHLDLLPTLLELCAVKTPQKRRFDGTSLVPLLKGKDRNWPSRTLIVESQRIERPKKWRKSAVMTDRWRLVNRTELYDIKADPGQKKNVADDNPAIVKRLTAAYESWWKDISPSHKKNTWIVLGSSKENPSRLTCHDWHGNQVPWNQRHIQKGQTANGYWTVEFAKAGTYEFELRRWPRSLNKAINDGKGPKATAAKIKIGDQESTANFAPDSLNSAFRMKVDAGRTRLQTWFVGPNGRGRGAYYVYVQRIEK
ncbi:MAG: arylsulfatase [Gemmataceae bacterium]